MGGWLGLPWWPQTFSLSDNPAPIGYAILYVPNGVIGKTWVLGGRGLRSKARFLSPPIPLFSADRSTTHCLCLRNLEDKSNVRYGLEIL